MKSKKVNLEERGLISDKFSFYIGDVNDFIESAAKKIGLFPKSFFPIRYSFLETQENFVTLGLTKFVNNSKFSWGDHILFWADFQNCNTGSKLASALIKNQDHIPQKWDKFKLFFPGTVFVDKNGKRYLTFLFKRNAKWEFKFRLIEGFIPLKEEEVRFVYDCRNVTFPKKIKINTHPNKYKKVRIKV